MKKLSINLVVLSIVAGFIAVVGAPLHSQAATAAANATATVVTPIAISKNADLAFGKFVANTGGTVVISTAGARSQTGTVALFTQGSTSNAASFAVTGEGVYTYAITLPATATITSSANTMTVGTFVSNPSGTGTLTAGAQTLLVGGTLTVASAQAAGSYTGSYNVSVDYN